MEGLRGFAVGLVFLVHFCALLAPMLAPGDQTLSVALLVGQMGNAGVDLFFVLSGYLIYGSLIGRPQSFVTFMGRRLRRVYPTFTVVFLAYVALSLLVPSESKLPGGPGASTLYLLANYLLLPGIFPIKAMITVAWSLSYEMFFYLIMPIAITGLSLRTWSSEARCWLLLAVAALGTAAFVVFGGPIRLVVFVSGMLLFERMKRPGGSVPSSATGAVLLVLGLCTVLLPLEGRASDVRDVVVLGTTFYVLSLVCFSRPNEWLARVFAWTPLRWLGNMSYSYYLIHGLALKALFAVLGKLLPDYQPGFAAALGFLVLALLLTLVPAALLFIIVERPFSLDEKPRFAGPAQLPATASYKR
jgi:exopolysaccharide production protein ExoZ